MKNVILRLIGSVGFALALGSAVGASELEAAYIGGFLYLLFSTTGND